MKTLIAALAILTVSGAAFAATEAAKPTQQNKMVTCNADAGAKKGDERKAFMKECLSAKPEKKLTPQQEKMKTCTKASAGKKGDDYKASLKACLSAK